MLKSIRFQNFKVLRDATLPLRRFTLLVGPNGSGKSTALQALKLVARATAAPLDRIRAIDASEAPRVQVNWPSGARKIVTFTSDNTIEQRYKGVTDQAMEARLNQQLGAMRFYSFDADSIAKRVSLKPNAEFAENGGNLAAVLDQLRDRDPERFRGLNDDLHGWLPEFDQVLFETPQEGMREVLLRVSSTRHRIRASELSHGTLFALALLTLAHSTAPPPFVAIEEPDRGVHPRLLRRIQDALYRLAHPEEHGDLRREPVQVVVTTHSPFFLDLYREHPEQIVIAEKKGLTGEFAALADRPDIDELLGDVGLGDLWYSGILGGVPREA